MRAGFFAPRETIPVKGMDILLILTFLTIYIEKRLYLWYHLHSFRALIFF